MEKPGQRNYTPLLLPRPPRVALLTSYIWEGAYLLDALSKKLNVSQVIIQRPWWGRARKFSYSLRYRCKLALDNYFGTYGNRYLDLNAVARRNRIPTLFINDINCDYASIDPNNIDLLFVAGSRILKSATINHFRRQILNFHTGVLPFFRGPYSEFWAMYLGEWGRLGTSIHLLTEGIDDGPLVGVKFIVPELDDSPETAHIKNVISGAEFAAGLIATVPDTGLLLLEQEASWARYFSSPSISQMAELKKRIGRGFNLRFGE